MPMLFFAEAGAEALSVSRRDLNYSVLTITFKPPFAVWPTTFEKIFEQTVR